MGFVRPARGRNGYRDFGENEVHKLTFLAMIDRTARSSTIWRARVGGVGRDPEQGDRGCGRGGPPPPRGRGRAGAPRPHAKKPPQPRRRRRRGLRQSPARG
ncbi:MAG: hypothetical protein OXK82_10810, partial [Deltaproteobacteria bacterium]|nr:hypothetical protein [Deltaproteobacteria bacterium]